MSHFKVPNIPESERTTPVVLLLEIIQQQDHQIQQLRDEIARLKGLKPRPAIKPSILERPDPFGTPPTPPPAKRPGSPKRSKTRALTIHETRIIRPEGLPPDATFKGYQEYTVQDLILRPHNTRYRLERWRTPSGRSLVAAVPAAVAGRHFGPGLIAYVLYQYHHQHVTQPLLREQLTDWGLDISAGQINRIITEGHAALHHEKGAILRTGLDVSPVIQVDDTQARHRGRNGHCIHIGNDRFAWFQSTPSKGRINLLGLLRAGHEDYVLNDAAFDYIRHSPEAGGVKPAALARLETARGERFADDAAWETALARLAITAKHLVKIVTEGALLGSAVDHGLSPTTVLVSDEAPQYRLLVHGVCWVHAERALARLIGGTPEHRAAIASVRQAIWGLYRDLKAYREAPEPAAAGRLRDRFRRVVGPATGFPALDEALANLGRRESELLRVLERPETPLHNNGSEEAIRDYVKKRKISGSTRSELGRQCRDTFATLKKTCRKLGVSFWSYLNDRVSEVGSVPLLPSLMRERAPTPG